MTLLPAAAASPRCVLATGLTRVCSSLLQHAVVAPGTERIRYYGLQADERAYAEVLFKAQRQWAYLTNLDADNKSGQQDLAPDVECRICLDTLSNKVAMLPCGHSFW